MAQREQTLSTARSLADPDDPLGRSEIECFGIITALTSRKLSHNDQWILACAAAEQAQLVTEDQRQADESADGDLRLAVMDRLGLVLRPAVFVGACSSAFSGHVTLQKEYRTLQARGQGWLSLTDNTSLAGLLIWLEATQMSEVRLHSFGPPTRRATVEQDTLDAVRRARSEEMSWAEVGKRLGVSAQAAHARYAGLIDD